MTESEQKKDEDDAESVRTRSQKRKQQALQVTRSLSGCTPKKRKTKAVDYLQLISQEQEGTADGGLYEICSDDSENRYNKAKGKKPVLDENGISKRREALDRDFSAALVSAENERSNQRQFLDSLQSQHEAHLAELKEFTREALEIMVQNNNETNKMLRELIENQQQFFFQLAHPYMAPPPPMPYQHPPPNHSYRLSNILPSPLDKTKPAKK